MDIDFTFTEIDLEQLEPLDFWKPTETVTLDDLDPWEPTETFSDNADITYFT